MGHGIPWGIFCPMEQWTEKGGQNLAKMWLRRNSQPYTKKKCLNGKDERSLGNSEVRGNGPSGHAFSVNAMCQAGPKIWTMVLPQCNLERWKAGLVTFLGNDELWGPRRSEGRDPSLPSLILMQCVRQDWDKDPIRTLVLHHSLWKGVKCVWSIFGPGRTSGPQESEEGTQRPVLMPVLAIQIEQTRLAPFHSAHGQDYGPVLSPAVPVLPETIHNVRPGNLLNQVNWCGYAQKEFCKFKL